MKWFTFFKKLMKPLHKKWQLFENTLSVRESIEAFDFANDRP